MNWGSLIFHESAPPPRTGLPWLKEDVGTCLVSHKISLMFLLLELTFTLCLEKNISEERSNLLLLATHSVRDPGPRRPPAACDPQQPPDKELNIFHSQWHHELFLCSSRSININSSSQKVGCGTTSSKSSRLSSYSIEEPWPSQTWEVILYHRLFQECVLDQVSVLKGVSWPRHYVLFLI